MREGAITLAPGQVWDERYDILAPLGDGTAMFVFKARDLVTGEVVALKIGESKEGRTSPYVLRQVILDYHVRRALRDPRIPRAHRLVLGATPYSVAELFELTDMHTQITHARLPTEAEAVAFIQAWTALFADLAASGVWSLDLVPKNICFDAAEPWTSARLVDLGHTSLDPALAEPIAPQLGALMDKLLSPRTELFQRFVEMLYAGCLFFEPWGKLAKMMSREVRERLPAPSARACRPELGVAAEWLDRAVAERSRWSFADLAAHIGLPPAKDLRVQQPTERRWQPALDDFIAHPRLRTLRVPEEAVAQCLAYLSQPERRAQYTLWHATAGIGIESAQADVPNTLERHAGKSGIFAPRLQAWKTLLAPGRKPLVVVMAHSDKADATTREYLQEIPAEARLLFVTTTDRKQPLFGEQTDIE